MNPTAQNDLLTRKLDSLYKKLTSLEKNQKRAEAILSHIHDGLLFINFKGIIKHSNQAALTFLHLEKDIVEEPFWNFFEDELFGFSMKEMLEKKSEKKHLILSLAQEEKKLELEVNTTFIPNEGLILILRDRSEVNRLEKTLRENERLHALGEMAATLAHEIRNPLGGITGFAALLLQDSETTPAQKPMIKAILEGTHLLNTLVTNVLTYARPCVINFMSISLKECLEEVLLYLSVENRNRVVIRCPTTLKIIADKSHFQRALLNLIQNGLEASAERKKVIVIAKKEGIITIKDQGAGILKEHLDKIMTPFFTTKIKGTGLGLSEANKIIQAHGFTLQLSSSTKGTEATIICQQTRPHDAF